MPDITITLSDVELAATADVAARQPTPITAKAQLEIFLHRMLTKPVEDFLGKQGAKLGEALADLDYQARVDFVAALALPTPSERIAALKTALTDYESRLSP
jgi:hypothetical protein